MTAPATQRAGNHTRGSHSCPWDSRDVAEFVSERDFKLCIS